MHFIVHCNALHDALWCTLRCTVVRSMVHYDALRGALFHCGTQKGILWYTEVRYGTLSHSLVCCYTLYDKIEESEIISYRHSRFLILSFPCFLSPSLLTLSYLPGPIIASYFLAIFLPLPLFDLPANPPNHLFFFSTRHLYRLSIPLPSVAHSLASFSSSHLS